MKTLLLLNLCSRVCGLNKIKRRTFIKPKSISILPVFFVFMSLSFSRIAIAQNSTPCFEDNTSANFTAGNPGSLTYISGINGGEVMLKPTAVAEFSKMPPTSEWNSFPWTGGTSSISNDSLIVNGSRFNSQPETTTYGPGTSLEFVATFGGAPFQHVGFAGGSDAVAAGGMFNGAPWAMFSTNNTSDALFARTLWSDNTSLDVPVANIPNLIGSAHTFKIDWKVDGSFEYFVDGNSVWTAANPNATTIPMRPGVSDFTNDAIPISVSWMRVTPFVNSGTFESRINDGGVAKEWGAVSWTANVPSGTSLGIFVRKGNSPTVDGTWTDYLPISASGGVIPGAASRYIQYRAELSTSNPDITPILKSISVSCNSAPVLDSIGPKEVSVGETLNFTATAKDPDGQSLVFSLLNAPDGATIDPATGVFSWKPTAANTYKFTVKVTDNGSPAASDQEEITVTVAQATPTNQPPVLASIGPKTGTVGQALTFTASATDPDAGQTKTFSLIGAPTGAAINATTGDFSWTPSAAGTFKLTVRVTDNGSPVLFGEEQITITVNNTTVQQVTTFNLINADLDQPTGTITEGSVLNLAVLPKNLNIQAITNPSVVGSVKMALSGAQSKNATETQAPYALFGDTNGDYNAWTPAVGSYTLQATPYTQASGAGTAGTALLIHFSVINQPPSNQYTLAISGTNGSVTKSPDQTSYASGTNVTLTATPANGYKFSNWSGDASGTTNPLTVSMTSNKNITANFTAVAGQQVTTFNLINADVDQVTGTITEGSVLNLAVLPKNLNIQAITNPLVVGSVKMALSGAQSKNATETQAPYALFGDTNGDYNAWTPAVGSYTLQATPYTQASGAGTAGTALLIHFSVINQPPSNQYTLAISATNGSVTKSPDQTSYASGTNVTLTATPANGYKFSSWSSDASGTTNPLTVSMTSNKNITANFTAVTGQPITLGPVADAFVRDGSYAAINYGTDPSLIVKSSATAGFSRSSYLKFSLSNVSHVVSAKLRIYGNNTENTTGVSISAYGVNTDSWTETGITKNNAPTSLTAVLSSVSVNNVANYYELDVTTFVRNELAGDKVASFVIKDPANKNINLAFNSRENAQNQPQLVIQTATAVTSFALRSDESLVQARELGGQSRVFPNPVHNVFSVALAKAYTGKVSFQIIDAAGRVYQVSKATMKASSITMLDISDLRLIQGIYLLRVLSEGGKSELIKLVVQ